MIVDSGKVMVRFCLIAVLITFSTFSFAQIRLENLSLKDTSIKEMFKGWNNSLHIVTNDTISTYKIVAKHSKIKRSPFKNNSFWVRNNRLGNDTISILKDGNIVKTEQFIIKDVPHFKAWVGQPNKTLLSAQQVYNSRQLFCIQPDLNLRIPYSPIGFNITIKDNLGKLLIQGKNRSFRIEKDYLNIIKGLKKNATILYSGIILYPSPDCGGALLLEPLLIKIK